MMSTNQIPAPTNVSQSEPPKRQRNDPSANRRATSIGENSVNVGGLFGGWGPRLG
jgi:hypothetical protein